MDVVIYDLLCVLLIITCSKYLMQVIILLIIKLFIYLFIFILSGLDRLFPWSRWFICGGK